MQSQNRASKSTKLSWHGEIQGITYFEQEVATENLNLLEKKRILTVTSYSKFAELTKVIRLRRLLQH